VKIGIDQISFYVPKSFVDLEVLAKYRGIDPNKYTKGLLQKRFSVSLNEDIVFMAANAARNLNFDTNEIGMVLFATESSNELSKALATNLLSELNLNSSTIAVEIKQACYGLTASLDFARGYVTLNPNKKVLLVSADIARYELGSAAEPTSGAGAVAILVSLSPRILEFTDDSSYFSEDSMDFFRPIESTFPIVDGKLSTEVYQNHFIKNIEKLFNVKTPNLEQYQGICLHIPYSKLALKAIRSIEASERIEDIFFDSIEYNQNVGNIYNGSLYLNLIGLLDNCELLANKKILMFSFGSGATSKLFSLRIVDGYQNHLYTDIHKHMLANTEEITIEQYEQSFDI